MNLRRSFEIAFASVTGSDHINHKKPNQDRLLVHQEDDFILLLLSDGCSGAGGKSEIGAQAIIEIASAFLLRYLRKPELWKQLCAQIGVLDEVLFGSLFFEQMTMEIRSALTRRLRDAGEDLYNLPGSSFLATCSGALILPERTILFQNGELCGLVNDEYIAHGGTTNGAPCYLIYTAADPRLIWSPEFSIQICGEYPTAALERLVVATDGWSYYLANIGALFPYAHGHIPSPKDLFLRNEFFRDSKYPQKLFEEIGRPFIVHGVHCAYLYDDFTAIFVRRVPEEDDRPTIPAKK